MTWGPRRPVSGFLVTRASPESRTRRGNGTPDPALRGARDFGSLIHTQTIHRCMGFKTISLSDAVYRHLRAEKRSGESFSEAIARLLAAKQPPLLKKSRA